MIDLDSEAQNILTVSNLSRTVGKTQILFEINLKCRKGDIVAVIGPNGSGKTTLIECISGLQPHQSGTVEIFGKVIAQGNRHEHIFYQPDQILPYPDYGVFSILDFFRKMMDVKKKRLDDLIERLKLVSVLDKSAKELSRGYQKRLLIAIGLLSKCEILMLDEPFEGLDIKQTKEVVSILQEEKELGKTLILSIHQITDAQRIADSFLLLSSGKLLGYGQLDVLRKIAGLSDGSLEDIFVALT